MKNIVSLISIVFFVACQKAEVVSPAVYACDEISAANSANHPQNNQYIAAMEKVKTYVPGVQVAIRNKDGQVWTGAQGFADIPNQVPFVACTKTMIGSVSKIYTAALVMQLHEENILSIEDPISEWVAADIIEQIENADKVSIKQLLNHSSGIKDYLETEHHIASINVPNYKLSPEEKLAYVYGKPAEHAPDVQYSYSNSNYVLLGLIIERARNRSLKEVVYTYISEPLNFQITEMGTTDDPIPTGTARPYLAVRDGKYVDTMPFSVADAATGDGGIATNMLEALTFLESLFNHQLISAASLKLMLEEVLPVDGRRLIGINKVYGLGLRQLTNEQYGPVIGHSGSTSAYWSELYHFTESKVTIAVAFNGDTEQEYEFEQLIQMILEVIDIAHE